MHLSSALVSGGSKNTVDLRVFSSRLALGALLGFRLSLEQPPSIRYLVVSAGSWHSWFLVFY
jgi:hypothetical protein